MLIKLQIYTYVFCIEFLDFQRNWSVIDLFKKGQYFDKKKLVKQKVFIKISKFNKTSTVQTFAKL